MKILMLVNWKIEYKDTVPEGKQPPDYFVKGKDYWFFRYFMNKPEVDVVDISSFPWLENFEKKKLKFYLSQSLRIIPKLKKYDLVISHGMQSGVVVALWRSLFKTKTKHIVFDIGSFASASTKGMALKLMQFACRSIDGLIYHTRSQINYYKDYFPYLVNKSEFIRFGTDAEFFDPSGIGESRDKDTYIVCVGYIKRDWDTLVSAYKKLETDIKLRLIGHVEERYNGIPGIEQLPFMSLEEIKKQIVNSRFCVLPLENFNYSFGQMTLLQQMALGKCVITAKVPSMLDYAEDMKTALFYEPGNVNDLAIKMSELLSNENEYLAEEIAVNARNYVRNISNEVTMAEEIENFITKIMQ